MKIKSRTLPNNRYSWTHDPEEIRYWRTAIMRLARKKFKDSSSRYCLEVTFKRAWGAGIKINDNLLACATRRFYYRLEDALKDVFFKLEKYTP